MLTQRNGRTTRTLAAAMMIAGTCAGLSPGALAQASGDAAGLGAAASPKGSFERAMAVVESGRLVEGKAMLDRALRSATTEIERERLLAAMKLVDTKLKAADPIEVSLQRAEFGLAEGDLRAAERWAGAVRGKDFADAAAKRRAGDVLSEVESRRAEIASRVPGMVQQANADFAAGRYGAAKSGILAVLRSGVTLDADVAHTLEKNQLRIVELERERGASFDVVADARLSMMGGQPGQVRRPNQPEQPSEPPPAPEMQPTEPPPAPSEPPPPPPPPPPSEPVSTPMIQPTEPAPAPAPADNQSDLIRAAMRAEAQRVIAEADQAYDSARYSVAADKYDIAIRQFRAYLEASELSHAQARLDEARVRLSGNQPGNLAEQVRDINSLQRQQAVAEFENQMSQARAALEAGNPELATQNQASAGLAISRARDLFTPTEYDEYTRRLEAMRRDIETKREQIVRTERDTREQQAREDAARAEQVRMNERDRKVNESIDRIRALQQEMKYEEALQVTEQVLFLDPNNPTGLLLHDILSDIVVYRRYNQIQISKSNRHALASLDSEEATIPPRDIMDFPLDWPSKTFQRGEQSAFADAPENRRVLADLASKKLPADFNDNKLEDVLTYIQKLTNVDMDVEWDSLEAMNVRKDTPITLKLSPVPVQTLLDRVLAKAVPDQFSRAGWTVYNGVLTVASQEQLNKNRTLVIYNIQDLLFEIPDYTRVPEIDLNTVLRQSQGGGGGTSPFRANQNNNENRPDREERIRQIVDIIQANVDFEGWRDNGGDVGTLQELNGSLIVTNTPKNHREIVGLLSKLREIRNMQINVETKFLLVNQSWFEQIGFDLDVVINANNNQFRAINSQIPRAQPKDFFDFSGDNAASVPGRAGLIPNANLNADNDQTDPGEQPGVVSWGNPRGWSPIGALQNSFGLTTGLARSAVQDDSVTAQVLRASPALGIAGQFLDDVQVDFLIVATQADRRTVQLTAPRLTFTNGQTANIYVVTQQAFVSDLQPVVGNSAVGFDPQVDVVSEGVTMLIEGVISADRRYVTMNIEAGVARIDGFGQQPVSAVAGGQLVNSADTQSFIQLPTITVTRVQTTATVPDEGTVLLGGQRLVTEVEIETGVPVLSKIPILNRFFTNRLESKEEQTLLILVKPTVLIQSEQEEAKFPGLLDSVRTGIGR